MPATGPRLLHAIVLLIALGSALIAACSDNDDETSTSGAASSPSSGSQGGSDSDNVCQDVKDLEAALQQVRGLSSSSSRDDIQKARSNVQTAYQDLRASLQAEAQAASTRIQESYSDLQARLGALSGAQNLAQAVALVRPSLETISQAVTDLKMQRTCA